MMLMDREFRKGLDECLGRLSRGDDVRSCLEAYPKYADRLEPYLRAASTLSGLSVPQPSAGAQQKARRRLLNAVAGKGPLPRAGGLTWVPAPLLRAGTVAVALLMFMIAAIGASAALGGGDAVNDVLNALHLPSPIGGGGHGDDEGVELRGRVISVSRFGFALLSEGDVLFVRYSDDTKFEDADGEPISREELAPGMDVFVRATPRDTERYFDARFVRIGEAHPTPTPEPEPTATPEPTVTPKPEEPAPPPEETPIVSWKEVAFDGKIKSVASGSFVLYTEGVMRTFLTDGETVIEGALAAGAWAHVSGLQSSEGTFLARHVSVAALEFWATVVSVSSDSIAVQIEGAGPGVVVHTAGASFSGDPFAGVKVWIKAYKNADGSYQALSVTVKTAEIYGTVTAISGSTYTVTADGGSLTVATNGNTVFVGTPVVGSLVTAAVYKMGDGTFLAYKVIVKEGVFSGLITQMGPAANTIYVNVGGDVKEVCTEFADIIGTLAVGATVEVHVDHTEGSTYFASLVKVTG